MIFKRWFVIGGYGLLAMSGFALNHYISVKVSHVMQAAGPDAEPSIWASLSTALTAFGGVAGVIGVLVSWLKTGVESLPNSLGKDALRAAVSLGTQPLYAKIYNAETDPAIKASLRKVAFDAMIAKFDTEFPLTQ